ncbi:MAG: PEP-CTERM sorting domain-containing protein [Methylibium sp.]|nr:PEP-CTERM sorting domain-containing protein [Methylibium sp.]
MTFLTSLRRASLPLLAAGLFAAGTVQAAPISFAGTLAAGSIESGSVLAESGPFGNGDNWSFWQFSVPFLEPVSITVTPLSAGFDPIVGVWYGIESDTANYFDMLSSSLNTTFAAGADGSGPFDLGGVGEPATVSFDNVFGTGPFVLAIADYADGLGSGSLDYRISVTAPIPEPQTYALMGLGLALMAGMMRARRRD